MAKIIIKMSKSFCGSAHKFAVYLKNTYIGELKTGGQLEINVNVGSHMLFFKSSLKLGKSPDTSFETVVNEPDEVVELKAGFHCGNGNFTVEYADNAPHIPTYANLNDIGSDTHSLNKIRIGQKKLYCYKCGTEMSERAKFCTHCGQAINQPYIHPQTYAKPQNLKYSNLITCRSCGALVAKTAKSCPKCGAKTPGQLMDEAIQGIGCGLLIPPIAIFLIVFYYLLFKL